MPTIESKPVEKLSAEEARNIFVRAQGFDHAWSGKAPIDVVRWLGAVQLDTISVLARSHELVTCARLGPVARAEIEQAYWSTPARTFEYIGHAACILPIELWPYFAFRRRAVRIAQDRLPPPEVLDQVRFHLDEGPVTTSGVGGEPRQEKGFWRWSAAKMALDGLYRRGEAAVTARRRWQRVYDLPERVIPPELLNKEPSDEECYNHLVGIAGRAMGIGTAADIGNYFHLNTGYWGAAANPRRLVAAAIEAAGMVPVAVEGWPERAFLDPRALNGPSTPPARTALISPFDPLIWATPRGGELQERERTRRVFGFSYSFEAYVRKEDRRYGYYVMPLLTGGRLAGRVDPRREGRTLVAAYVSIEGIEDLEAMGEALREAANWVGCDSVRLERVEPLEFAEPLRRLLE